MVRSFIQRAGLEITVVKYRDMTQHVTKMKSRVAQMLIQMRETTKSAIPMHQNELMLRENVIIKLPNDTDVELQMGVYTMSLNNTTMGMANTSPVHLTTDNGLLERRRCTSVLVIETAI